MAASPLGPSFSVTPYSPTSSTYGSFLHLMQYEPKRRRDADVPRPHSVGAPGGGLYPRGRASSPSRLSGTLGTPRSMGLAATARPIGFVRDSAALCNALPSVGVQRNFTAPLAEATHQADLFRSPRPSARIIRDAMGWR